MRPVRTFLLGLGLGVMSTATLGCPPAAEKGPMEKAGQKLDKAAQQAADKAKEAAGAIEGAATQAAGAIEGAATQAADAIEGAATEAKEGMNK